MKLDVDFRMEKEQFGLQQIENYAAHFLVEISPLEIDSF